MNGIIYTRVSSDEQIKGTSLEFQEELCRKYCAEKGIDVLELFREEGASAKTADRKELLRALEYCRKHKSQVQAFIVAKVDRFARNTEDHFYVRKLLLEYGVTLHSVTEPIGNSPTEKFVETVLAASSEFDNAIRKQRCTDGMVARLGQGIWPWKPPPGYRCQHAKKQGEKKTRPDPPDPELFPLLQRALKEYAKGVVHSQAELARLLDSWGLRTIRGRQTTPQFVDRLLGTHLKFYAGVLVSPFTGEERPGQHTPMITSEEFHRIRLVRSGKAKIMRRDRQNPLFPLRRTISCGSCHRLLTGGVSRGNGGQYAYYHCSNRQCPRYGKAIPKSQLESAFVRYLTAVAPREDRLAVFGEVVLDLWRTNRVKGDVEREKYGRQIAELEERRKRIFEMREDGSYSREEFRERLAEAEGQLADLKRSAGNVTMEDFDIEAALSYALQFIQNLSTEWFKVPRSLRPRFQKLVFPFGIPYDRDHGFGTAELGLLLQLSGPRGARESQLVHLVSVSWNQFVECLREFHALKSLIVSMLATHHSIAEDGGQTGELAA
jgi:site-specific DNA recombinase